ncbi:efflux RND transporter periplasmic adaptor subunit [Acidihalobacter yilgarnensis]|nr:HlyD family secretion protein [Acidihalobacter yilgarnensis]
MNPSPSPRLRRWLWLCALLPWMSVHAGTPRNTPAETVTYHPRYMAYAAVEPLQQLTIRADHAGYLKDLTLRPGDRLRSGTPFARLIGPAITAALRQAETTLVETRRRATLAADSLRSAQRTYPAFTNRRELNAAKAAVASTHAALQQAKTALDSLRARVILRSPANGQVTALRAANGERVTPGSPILTLLPSGGLWLRAAYYGGDSQKITLGMQGRFIPADGNSPIAVRVIRKIPRYRPTAHRASGCSPYRPQPGRTVSGAASSLKAQPVKQSPCPLRP